MDDLLECDGDNNTQSSSDNESDSLDYDISQLPKSVLSCWAFNRAYQQSLKDFKEFLERKLEENRAKQEELNLDLNEDEASSSTSGHSSFHTNSLICFMSPYFKDIKGLHPPPNEDVTIKKMKGEINQVYIRTKSFWRANDKKKLIELVKLASFKKSLEPLKRKENLLISQIKEIEKEGIATDKMFSLKFDLREVEEQLKIDSSQDVDKFVPKRENNDKIDWLEISAQIGSSHPPLACEIKWLNELHPDINHEPWSQEEDKKLQELVEKYNNDWDKISNELATNRIAYQCICRYQSFLNPQMKRKGLFSKAEQDLVNEVIANCRVGSYIPWNQVSYFIEGRSLAQVKHYWEKRNSLTKNRKWTELEDNVLIQAVEKFGLSNWVKVAYFLPGRTNRQCRERYIMRLGVKNRKVAEWSSSEDKKLLELAPAFNYRWATLVNHINGRNPHQIASRYDVLEKISLKRSGKSLDLNDGEGNLLEDSKLIPRRKRKCIQNEETNSIKSRLDISSKDEFLRESRRKLEQMLKRELSKNVKKVDAVNNLAELDKQCGEAQTKKVLYYDNKKKKRVIVKQNAVDQELLQLFGLYSLYRKPTTSKGSARSGGDTIILDNIQSVLKSSLMNTTLSQTHMLSQVIETAMTNFVTHKNKSSNSTSLPALLPPNIATMHAFHSLLLQRQHLNEEIACSIKPNKSDPKYVQLLNHFISLFVWPYLLSLNSPPDKPSVPPKTVVKPKSKSNRSKSALLSKTREKQRRLLSSALG